MPNKVEVDVLESANRDDLLASLRQGYHVLHYIGHSMVQGGEGYLVLQDDRKAFAEPDVLLLKEQFPWQPHQFRRLDVQREAETTVVPQTLDGARP
ncbi:hypothetical protein ACFLTC_01680 [Chloroflexota bacterium]